MAVDVRATTGSRTKLLLMFALLHLRPASSSYLITELSVNLNYLLSSTNKVNMFFSYIFF